MSAETPIPPQTAPETNVPAPAAPQPAPSSDQFMGMSTSTIRYATLATLLYFVINSPIMYKLTKQIAPTCDVNGCYTYTGIGMHAVVYGLLVFAFIRFDCSGKNLTLKEQLTITLGGVALYFIIGAAVKTMCNKSPDRYAYRYTDTGATVGTNHLAVMVGGAIAFFLGILVVKTAYDRFGREDYMNYSRQSINYEYN
jgi:hypothetical protein